MQREHLLTILFEIKLWRQIRVKFKPSLYVYMLKMRTIMSTLYIRKYKQEIKIVFDSLWSQKPFIGLL